MKVLLVTVFRCVKCVMVSVCLQTAARSEVGKHQKWNQRCPTPQVTPAALLTELLCCFSQHIWRLFLLIFSPQVVQQHQLAQAAHESARRPHRPTDTQGKSTFRKLLLREGFGIIWRFCVADPLTLLLNTFNETFDISPEAKCFCVSLLKFHFLKRQKTHSKF